MPLYGAPHKEKEHAVHLCNLFGKGITLAEWAKLVENPKFICKQCGRAAAKAENLCDPVTYEDASC